jgi:O-antigen/teichoic acid export membrane protein
VISPRFRLRDIETTTPVNQMLAGSTGVAEMNGVRRRMFRIMFLGLASASAFLFAVLIVGDSVAYFLKMNWRNVGVEHVLSVVLVIVAPVVAFFVADSLLRGFFPQENETPSDDDAD